MNCLGTDSMADGGVKKASVFSLQDRCAERLEKDDFFMAWDRKLQARNEKILQRVLAWCDLLEVAGWCVAFRSAGGDCWVGPLAERDLLKKEKPFTTWAELWNGFAAGSYHLRGPDLLVWAGESPREAAVCPVGNLTRREAEVMDWLRQGKTTPEMALILGCAVRTVEKHLANLYTKIGVRNRTRAILAFAKAIIFLAWSGDMDL